MGLRDYLLNKDVSMADAWWKHTVFYQIYPRSFCDSNGDGIGDIPGIISKLDYLKDLGIGAVWLSPVYQSPNHDNGYDISDYYNINPEYGTLEDMKRLFAEAKKRDIRIIMDLVINHTSDEHPWFVAAQDPASPYRDYYIWKDANLRWGNKRVPPNNWWSYFGGSAWQWHPESGQYYLHLFNAHQPDLNYRNPKVIAEIKKIMRYWLDMGAAGFRWDTISVIYKTSFDNGRFSLSHLPGNEHYFSQPGAHAILAELRHDVLDKYDAYTVGEMTDKVTFDTAQRFTTGELDTIFTFDHLRVGTLGLPFWPRRYHPSTLKTALTKWQRALPWNTLFFENHDTERSLSKFEISEENRTKGATMLATLLLTLKGVPFIYQGEEIGMENYPFRTIEMVQDISTRSVYMLLRRHWVPPKLAFRVAMLLCRDHARTPMQWDSSLSAGFSTNAEPWRPVHPRYKNVNVAIEQSDETSIYAYYRKLIAFRKQHEAFQDGECTLLPSSPHVMVFRREKGEQHYIVAVNLSSDEGKCPFISEGHVCAGNYEEPLAKLGQLRPYEAVIFAQTEAS